MQCAGMVILSDNYDQDWNATVDGKPAKLWPVDTVIRGVEVPAGVHKIEMHYRPMPVYVGAGLLALSVCGVLALVLAERKASA